MAVEKQTFSSCIDEIISITGRKDRLADLPGYVNSTILRCDALQIFRRDMIEDQLTATTDNFIWTYPENFRIMRTVQYYGNANASGSRYSPDIVWPDVMPPGKAQRELDHCYYGGPGYYVFKGVNKDAKINIAYYIYQPRLIYYAEPRPAIFLIPEIEDTHPSQVPYWQYWDENTQAYVDTLGSPEADQAAQALVTNWLMYHWYDCIKEGALSVAFKSVDDARYRTAYSVFKEMQDSLKAMELYDTLGR